MRAQQRMVETWVSARKNQHVGMIEKGQLWISEHHGPCLVLDVYHDRIQPGYSHVEVYNLKTGTKDRWNPTNLILWAELSQ